MHPTTTQGAAPMPTTRLHKPKPNYRFFEELFRENQISQREVARRLNMDPGGLNRRLKGKARLQSTEAAELARLLHIPVEEVLTNAGVRVDEHIKTPRDTAVPLIGWIGVEMDVHIEKVKGTKTVEAPPVAGRGLRALRFQTAMSKADAFDGAIAYFIPASTVHSDAIGKLCVVTLADGMIVLRIVKPGYARGRYNLVSSIDGSVTEDAVIESAAPVVWLKL